MIGGMGNGRGFELKILISGFIMKVLEKREMEVKK